MAAQHSWEGIAGKHGSLAGSAARNHIIRRPGIQKHCGQNSVLHIGEGIFVLRTVHTIVKNLVSHRFRHALQRGTDQLVLSRLAVLID